MLLYTSQFLVSSARNAVIRSSYARIYRRLLHSETGRCFVNNVDLFYETTGNASQVILCVPGALGSTQTHFGPQLEQLKDNFTVVSFDPRGYGKSIPPERDFPLDYHHRDAEDAVGLMKELGYTKYSVLGWCDGGISSLIIAGKYPELVDRLVVWQARATATETDLEPLVQWLDISSWTARTRKNFQALYGIDEAQRIRERVVACITNIVRINDGNYCAEFLPKIKCPTLILHGAKNSPIPTFHGEYIHKNIKGSKLHIMPEGEHNIHLKNAEEFNKLVTDFCTDK